MDKIKQLNVFQTTDGLLHEKIEDAERHQDEIDFKEKLTELLEKEWYRGIDIENVVELLVKNREMLK